MIVLYIILAIIAIPFVLAIFASSQYTISRSVVIAKPKAEVFDYVKHIKNQDHFNKWVMADPGMQKTFTGTDGNVGFIYAWDSANKQVGKGAQEITKITDDRIDTEVRFEKPFEGVAWPAFVVEESSDNETHVTWLMKGDKNYMAKVMHIVLRLEKVLADDIQTSLNTLKTILEK